MSLAILCNISSPGARGATAKIIYVDDDAIGANDGSSWENAYIYLQDALTDAKTADKPVEIRVAQGTYKPNQGANQTSGNRNATFQLINNVTIKGGYAGIGEVDPNVRDAKACKTILTGDLRGNDVAVDDPSDLADGVNRWDNSSHVVTGSDTNDTAVLDGFVILSGYAVYGGGMYNSYGSPTVSNCTFEDNFAGLNDLIRGNGAGMYNEYSNPKLVNCTFSRNCVGFRWGFKSSRFTITGGGMYNYYSNPKLIGCTFTSNVAFSAGGGLSNDYSSPELTDCLFTANITGAGGAIFNYSSNPKLTNCTLAGNIDFSYGHAVACDSEDQQYPSRVEFTNCILWNGQDQIWNNDASTIIITYCDVQDGWEGEGNINEDPLFTKPGYWADVNDPDIVVEPNDPNAVWVDGDYHLKSQAGRFDQDSQSWVVDDVTSPCIDAGDPNTPVGHEPMPNGGRINMGAYGGMQQASMSPVDVNSISVISKASDPIPADEAIDVDLDTILAWTTGLNAVAHEVYFGTSNFPLFIRKQFET